MNAARRTLRSERGAVFVQVGIGVFVLMSFMVFVLDYGIMWTSRRQAQNAADAGALAGATARSYDDFDDPPSSTGPAAQAASGVASANLIWQQPGTSLVSFDCPAGETGRCVRVDVYRNGLEGSTSLPTLFGPLLGIASQGVRATATAASRSANAVNCLRPFALPDKWTENGGSPQEFNRYGAGGTLLASADEYIAPSATQAPSYTLAGDFGRAVFFDYDQSSADPINDGSSLNPAGLLPIALPGTTSYEDNIAGCNGQTVALHDQLPLAPPAAHTWQELHNLATPDWGAAWNHSTNEVENSCAPTCGPLSPRLIAIVLYDPDHFQLQQTTGWPDCGGTPCIKVSNIAGFFLDELNGGSGGHGDLTRHPGVTSATAPTFANQASWLVTTTLIR